MNITNKEIAKEIIQEFKDLWIDMGNNFTPNIENILDKYNISNFDASKYQVWKRHDLEWDHWAEDVVIFPKWKDPLEYINIELVKKDMSEHDKNYYDFEMCYQDWNSVIVLIAKSLEDDNSNYNEDDVYCDNLYYLMSDVDLFIA